MVDMSDTSSRDQAAASPRQSAGEVYDADLEAQLEPPSVVKRMGRRTVRGTIRAVSLGISAMVGDYTPPPSLNDLVIRRRSDRSVVMRIDAGTVEEAGTLLNHVRSQLDDLDIEEFEQTWDLGSGTVHA